jgi:hypothetical protein
MRSVDARHRNFIGLVRRARPPTSLRHDCSRCCVFESSRRKQTSGCTPSYQSTGFALACDSYARTMLSRLGTSRIPTPFGSLTCRGVNPCSTLPCSSALHSCACTSLTSASAIAGETGRGGGGWQVTPMPFLCPARASAVDFLCASGPLSSRHEIANSYPVALGRYRPSGAFRCWRLSDARRSADRDRRGARDSPRGGRRRHRDLAIVRDRLSDPSPPRPKRRQPCSMSS